MDEKIQKHRQEQAARVLGSYTQSQQEVSSSLEKAQGIYQSNRGIIASTLRQEGRHTPNTLRLQKENAKLKEQYGDKLSKSQVIEKSKRDIAFQKQYKDLSE